MNSEISITILCDNFVNKPVLLGEHGFSVLVEFRGTADTKKLLFVPARG